MSDSVQSLERAVAILHVLADRQRQGARLADVSAVTGLSRSTAHRLLTTLVGLGLAEQDRPSGCYFPGLVLLGLGAAAANRHNLAELATPFAQELADRTGDTVYVAVRSGNMAVCVDRIEGAMCGGRTLVEGGGGATHAATQPGDAGIERAAYPPTMMKNGRARGRAPTSNLPLPRHTCTRDSCHTPTKVGNG